jgi:hypothetical protein
LNDTISDTTPADEPTPDIDGGAGSPADTAVITAAGLGVDGEHGPLFAGIDLALDAGFHAIQMPGGHPQSALLLTLAGRLAPSAGTVSVHGATTPAHIRRHCAIAAFGDIDDLEDAVTVSTVLAEQRRWLSPWYRKVAAGAGYDELVAVFGDLTAPALDAYIGDLTDIELFLLRVTLALMSERDVLIVGDLEQVRDQEQRAMAVDRLAALAAQRTVVVGVTNPLGSTPVQHHLHDVRALMGGL